MGVLASWAPRGMASTFDFGFFRGLVGFFTGALLIRLPRRDLKTAGELFAVVLAVGFVGLGRWTILSPLVFSIPVYVFAHSTGVVSRALGQRVPWTLGEWSYSIYLVHESVVAAIFALAPRLGLIPLGRVLEAGRLNPSVIAVAYMAIVVTISAATYWWIERPARDYFKGLSDRIVVRRQVARGAV